MQELTELACKEGIGVVAIVAGIWMLWYLIKYTVVRLGNSLDQLAKNMSAFTDRVRSEHDECKVSHKCLLDQHHEMMLQLKEITLTLGRINGYKHDSHS